MKPDHPKSPITALRRCEADLTLLRCAVRSLCETVARFDESVKQCRSDLEALAVLFQREFRQREELRRDREREEHVRDELANYDLNHPQGDED